ncbi:cyanate transporter [Rhizobium sp. TH2]|uniref:cyanate transporter n=1 Tax=Rhizobium sp. TH2 TaxID=2775403 RepID=UPI002157D064|nr:cyanate transporter [Rhizobium sp. TH2]UVC09436.1 cyanate transporter [Rhizobium sp. TH2]
MIAMKNPEGKPGRPWAVLALVVLIGINLRPFLAAPGPLLVDIGHDLGMSLEGISVLTLLPMLLMGIGAFVSPRIQAAIGTRRGMLIALSVLAIGSILRLEASSGVLLILTAALCGASVAFIQAAFPGIIKENFPNSIAVVTGLYSAVIMGGGALGARAMPALTNMGFSWRAALAWLAAPAVIALAAAWLTLKEARSARPDKNLVGHLLSRPRTWALMAAFGLVNGGYSSVITWLAPYYQSLGWRSADSANLVAIMAICQAVAALALPALARHGTDRRPWLLLTLAMQAIGFAGLAFSPDSAAAFWVGICGAGLGSSFALAIVTALDHLPHPEQAGALVALMQGGGFLLASVAPLLLALLHDWTGTYSAGWIMHIGFVAVTSALYLSFKPESYAAATRLNGLAPGI